MCDGYRAHKHRVWFFNMTCWEKENLLKLRGQVWEIQWLVETLFQLWGRETATYWKWLKGNTVYHWHHLLIPFCHFLFLVSLLLKCNSLQIISLKFEVLFLFRWMKLSEFLITFWWLFQGPFFIEIVNTGVKGKRQKKRYGYFSFKLY